MLSRRAAIATLLGFPVALVSLAYLWLAADNGTLWLFPVIVHESRRYSLTDTLLYFRHFLREIPITVLYAAASVGAFRAYGPTSIRGVRGTWALWLPCLLSALLVVTAGMQTVREWGTDVAFWELLQAYTRDDFFRYGSHWRFHFLSSIAYLAGAVSLASLLGYGIEGSFPRPCSRERKRWIGGTLLVMVALTVLFRPTLDPFVDPRYIGHQAREVVTHLLIALPLSFGALVAASRSGMTVEDGGSCGDGWGAGRYPAQSVGRSGKLPTDVAVALAAWVLLLTFLMIAAIATGASRRVRPDVPLSSLLAAHAFEHFLDYLMVLLLSIGLARATVRGADAGSRAGTGRSLGRAL